MIEGESGNKIYVKTGIDLSAVTNYRLKFRGENKSFDVNQLEGVSIGAIDIEEEDGSIILANTYFEYTFLPGDISIGGRWSVYPQFDQPVIGKKSRKGKTFHFYVEEKLF